jgi:spore coat protein H
MNPRLPFTLACILWCVAVCFGADESKSPIDFEPNIPVLLIETKSSLQLGETAPAKISIKYPKASGWHDASALKAQLKYHGAVSLGFDKKSMGFKLDDPLSIAGMAERSHWVLNAAFIDRSMMRHKLSYDLFASMSSPGKKRHAAPSRFVEVYFNGKYRGAYLLMERIDRQLLGLRKFRADDAEHACIYKSVDHSAVFNQEGHWGYEQHEPDPKQKPYWEPLDKMNGFANRSDDAAFFDPKTGMVSRLDLSDAMDFHLHLLMVCNQDSPTKNFVIARDGAKTAPAPPFFFVPWDNDATFGRNWDGGRVSPQGWLSNYLYDRLLKNPDYRKRFVERWAELRKKQFSVDALDKTIDGNVHILGPAAQRNEARWREQSRWIPDNLTFEQDIAQMHAWVRARLDYLDHTISELAAH